ncbi:hypothetical protein CXF85_01950 [Colwellia sp. 75C3]|uniref:hypothetical protein n=1 Tax=Colwellia sp. 75C3 TaxID=888425 RepID=UPI000C32DFAB|nr:hypothetical protein [Colwellia sp. 75C3]PKG86490.1 hypothetical protein CXF85_01950 [Colwellia sp. 75C3]
MPKRIPHKLKGKVWHSTSFDNAVKIIKSGSILSNPNISTEDKWGGNSETDYPFVKSIGGISLFDFRLPESHSSELLYRWVPCQVKFSKTVWFEIDTSKLHSCFLSAEDTLVKWEKAGMTRNYMPYLEASCISPIDTQYIKSILIGDQNGGLVSEHLSIFV